MIFSRIEVLFVVVPSSTNGIGLRMRNGNEAVGTTVNENLVVGSHSRGTAHRTYLICYSVLTSERNSCHIFFLPSLSNQFHNFIVMLMVIMWMFVVMSCTKLLITYSL